MKIGLYGGAFNPVHIAHLIIAEQFVDELALDKCVFSPAHISPFKAGEDSADDPTPEQRYEMTRLAIENNTRFDISDYEIRRGGTSYSIDTIRHLEKTFPGAELFLLIGADQAKDFKKWKDWKEILEAVRLCIAHRPEIIPSGEKSSIDADLTLRGKSPLWLRSPEMTISATDLRQRFASGRSARYLVPEKTLRYIKENGLYNIAK